MLKEVFVVKSTHAWSCTYGAGRNEVNLLNCCTRFLTLGDTSFVQDWLMICSLVVLYKNSFHVI